MAGAERRRSSSSSRSPTRKVPRPLAEGEHVVLGEAPELRRLGQERLQQRLLRDDGDLDLAQQLRLRLGDPLDRLDQLQVHGPDVRDHADVRPRERAEPGDLAHPAHRQLEHADLRVLLEPAERQRNADLVVEARLGRDRPRVRGAERGEDVLRRGLAGRAGDADDLRRAAGADGAADRAERGERAVRDERGRGAAGEGVLDEGAGSVVDRDEEVALLDPARVDLDAGHLARPRLGPELAERLDLLQRQRDHARDSQASAASRARPRGRRTGGRRRRPPAPARCPCPRSGRRRRARRPRARAGSPRRGRARPRGRARRRAPRR